jgi:hypothetical protein
MAVGSCVVFKLKHHYKSLPSSSKTSLRPLYTTFFGVQSQLVKLGARPSRAGPLVRAQNLHRVIPSRAGSVRIAKPDRMYNVSRSL